MPIKSCVLAYLEPKNANLANVDFTFVLPSFLLIFRGKPKWKSIGPIFSHFRVLKNTKRPYLKIPFCPSGHHQKAYSS